MTPAIEAGFAIHLGGLDEIVGLLEAAEREYWFRLLGNPSFHLTLNMQSCPIRLHMTFTLTTTLSTPGISANAILASGVSNGLVFLQDRENWATRSNFLVIRRE